MLAVEANLLSNSGFETGDFTGWSQFGQGWRTGTGGDAYSGTYGAVSDVLTNDTDEWRGLYQNVEVSAGLSYDASFWQRAINLESSESWLELQWLDNTGSIISQTQTVAVTTDQVYTFAGLDAQVAPGGAVTASVRGIVHMVSAPSSDPDFHTFDDFSFAETIPEPGALALVGLGMGVAIALRKRLK
jgi:hypothetical protein